MIGEVAIYRSCFVLFSVLSLSWLDLIRWNGSAVPANAVGRANLNVYWKKRWQIPNQFQIFEYVDRCTYIFLWTHGTVWTGIAGVFLICTRQWLIPPSRYWRIFDRFEIFLVHWIIAAAAAAAISVDAAFLHDHRLPWRRHKTPRSN